jgi:hypothetical protein
MTQQQNNQNDYLGVKMKIRIEGICGCSKVGIIIDSKYILYVVYIYEGVLPSRQLDTENQYYVVFDPTIQLQPIITTLELSPELRQWSS